MIRSMEAFVGCFDGKRSDKSPRRGPVKFSFVQAKTRINELFILHFVRRSCQILQVQLAAKSSKGLLRHFHSLLQSTSRQNCASFEDRPQTPIQFTIFKVSASQEGCNNFCKSFDLEFLACTRTYNRDTLVVIVDENITRILREIKLSLLRFSMNFLTSNKRDYIHIIYSYSIIQK